MAVAKQHLPNGLLENSIISLFTNCQIEDSICVRRFCESAFIENELPHRFFQVLYGRELDKTLDLYCDAFPVAFGGDNPLRT